MLTGGKLFLIVCACFANAQSSTIVIMENSFKLELVQVNFRHGVRTPNQYEARYVNNTDPTIYGSQGFDQLTNQGKYQVYKLGQLLRREYDDFLGNYEPGQLHAYSSHYDRTKMTLQLVLAGLYPPLEDDKWHPTLKWRPIPFSSAKSTCDTLTTPHQCKKYAEVYRCAIDNSEEYKSKMAEYNDLFDYMEKVTGIPFKTRIIYHTGWTYHAVKIHKLMNLPLPEWCYDEHVMNQIRDIFKYHLDAMSMTQKLKKINGGTMVRQVIENIETNRDAVKPKKLYLYSHHDLTLAAFERAQGTNAFDIPPFGSAIILEKYRGDNNVEYVRFLAWDGEDDKFFTVNVKGFGEFCPYDKYRELVKDVIPSDEELDDLVSAG